MIVRFKFYLVYGMIVLMFSACVVKMASVMVDREVSAVGNSQGRKTVTVATTRGTIYDRNMQPLVNETERDYAVFIPQYSLLRQIKPYMPEEDYRLLLDKATDGMPLSTKLTNAAPTTDHLLQFRVSERYGAKSFCPHLIGYLDEGTGQGISGLEKVYDDILNQYGGSVRVAFSTDGLGMPLESEEPVISNTIENSRGGIVLTIDKDIQRIVDDIASEYIRKGAVVVMDSRNGEILAMGSYPAFDPSYLEMSLDESDAPFINRALSLYDCGSVFKIVTALAALEEGVPPERCYDCTGSYDVDDTTFHCHNREGHGLQNMETAFANSCNAYFIQLAMEIGSDAMLNMIHRIGLDSALSITDGWDAAAAVLPSRIDLSADAALANLSFGQGDLMLSPLHTTVLAGIVASGGNRLPPHVVSDVVDYNLNRQPIGYRGGETIVSAQTVRSLRSMMEKVVSDGTGIRGKSDFVTSAGKTGTAETGQRNADDLPIVQSWFVGYFPTNYPRYVVTVFAEDAQNSGADTAKAFCEISNKLTLKQGNG